MKGGKAYRVNIEGLNEAITKLNRFVDSMERKPLRIIREEAPRILAEARRQVPYDTGKLHDSISVTASGRRDRAVLTAYASAKNGDFDYSLPQHEDLTYVHTEGRKAKYLEDPFTEGVERIIRRLSEEVSYDK